MTQEDRQVSVCHTYRHWAVGAAHSMRDLLSRVVTSHSVMGLQKFPESRQEASTSFTVQGVTSLYHLSSGSLAQARNLEETLNPPL